jgi:glycosyltransferase involved in cell wall biosynthesis
LAREVDVVHAHGLKAGWLAASVRPRAPLVVSVHNVVLDEVAGRAAKPLRILEGLLPRVVDRVIAMSPSIADRFGGRAVVIAPSAPPPVPTRTRAEVREAYGVAHDERLVVTVARLHPQKDLPTLFGAIARLENVRLLVVGEGPAEAQLRASAPSSVIFAGGRPDAADEMAAADVVVVSSRWESGPLALVEAMQLGRPVVSTAVGFAPDLVTTSPAGGITGRLVPVGDAVAMSVAIADLLDDAPAAAAIGDAARRYVAERHGPDAMVDATEAVYREVRR